MITILGNSQLFMRAILFSLFLLCSTLVMSQTAIRYVKMGGVGNGTSWFDASDDLQAMMDTVYNLGGGEVWVAKGTYYPIYPADGISSNPRDRSFLLKKDVQIYGGFSDTANDIHNAPHATMTKDSARNTRNWDMYKTILSGDIGTPNDNSDNCYHVVISANDVGTACLDGFIVRYGNANGISSITVNSQSINREVGGGIYVRSSSPALRHLVIDSNGTKVSGGGIFIDDNSLPIITNALIVGNHSDGFGGGIFILTPSSSILTNVTISRNHAMMGGGIYCESGASLTIRNTIIWGNTASMYQNINMGNINYQYCLVGGGTLSGNNIILNTDPIFEDPANGNFRLNPCSPAIDTGSLAFYDVSSIPNLSAITYDLGNNPRVFNEKIDLGAYEYPSSLDYLKLTSSITDTAICPGNIVNITLTFTGSAPWELTYTKDNGNTTNTISTSLNPHIWTTTALNTTTFKFISIKDAANCLRSINENIQINMIPIPQIIIGINK